MESEQHLNKNFLEKFSWHIKETPSTEITEKSPIEKNNLYVPICFHNICMTCAERCNKCPLCREIFVNIVIR